MVDHPLVSSDLRDYIFTHQIEKRLNQGLNNVLAKCNADPFSEMASALIDVSKFNS
jgi:hypothetical protein